jgi:hypothetical protein
LTPLCKVCPVLEREVAYLRKLVDQLMADRGSRLATNPMVPPPVSIPPSLGGSPPPGLEKPFQITGEDGREYVITPDGTLDTKANYDRAMSMLDRQLAGKASYDQESDREAEGGEA